MAGAQSRFVVVGGSIAGLSSALALARAGADVVVVDRDSITQAPDAEAAFALERPGVPQSHFVHAFLGRMVKVMRERFPDVLADLQEVGARIERPALIDPALLHPDVALLLARRTTVEWVLRRHVLSEPTVRVVDGCRVVGLEGTGTVVQGVRLEDGSTLEGQVIACSGRRSDLAGWLAPFGGTIDEHEVSSDLIYFTRWYRAPGFDMGGHIPLRDLGFLSYLVVPSDGDTLAVAMALPPEDRELRERLLDPEGFDRVAAMMPGLGEGLAASDAQPLLAPRPMAGLMNRLRRYTDQAGQPHVGGFVAVGDAHTVTNPAYGRGCSLALVQATLMADAMAAHADDPLAAGARYEADSAREVEPWFHSSVMMDQARSALRTRDDDASAGSGQPDLFDVMRSLVAGQVNDPVILDGFTRLFHVLTTPTELFSDASFVERLVGLVGSAPESVGRFTLTREEVVKTLSAAA